MDLGILLPLLAGTAILSASAISDLRYLRIPNTHVLAVLLVFAVAAPMSLSLGEFAARFIAAAVTFALGFGLFSIRMFGGGDVKMMAAVMLLVPTDRTALFLLCFALALLVSTLAIVVLQRSAPAGLQRWESCRAQGHVPVGLAIFAAVGSLAVLG